MLNPYLSDVSAYADIIVHSIRGSAGIMSNCHFIAEIDTSADGCIDTHLAHRTTNYEVFELMG